MSKEEVMRLGSQGGIAAHASGNAYRWTPEEAKVAGRKGGRAPHAGRGQGLAISSIVNATNGVDSE
jgi:general stress protein YciG